MPQPILFADYLDLLGRELSFDMPLSRRVRSEIEDHLWETIDDAADGCSVESQRRAIARLGDAREIACHYAASSLVAQTRRVAMVAVLAVIGIFLAMKGRGAWYGFVQWGLGDDLKLAVTIGINVTRRAFAVAMIAGIIGGAYVRYCRLHAPFDRGYPKWANRCVMLCTATAGALLATVVTDTILTGLRLSEAVLSPSALVPILSMGVEITLLSMLILHIRTTIRRAALVASLLGSRVNGY